MLRSLSANSYGIYLVHYLVIIWLQYAVLRVDLPGRGQGVHRLLRRTSSVLGIDCRFAPDSAIRKII